MHSPNSHNATSPHNEHFAGITGRATATGRAGQPVFARNPGDGPEAAAEYVVPFHACRIDPATARVHRVVRGMQASRPWDFKDERPTG
jgi:hypothetical protein